ncbi:MAG: Gfo/Idh/MocA family oxidoreductase [Candidatus Latescibacteria bacterium]|jgi:predicted dehydrogenase|nr:Gfo/Idh/MocA family oxidoreductase [Candidatus Latescibacterota bacterium]
MVTVGIIGAGYWGKNIIRTVNAIDSVKIKYISDCDNKTLEKFSAYTETIKTSDYLEILKDDEVNAVIISTPPVTHYKIARNALFAHKHVMVEKPITIETNHARELVKIAGEENLKLMVGHLLLYHPCVNAMKKYIDDGEIGEIFYLYSKRLNLGKVRKDENALLSFAPHDISVALYLLGKNPDSVSAYGSSYLQKDVEDVVFLNMHFPGGKIAHIHVSWLDPHKVRHTTVVGSHKMMIFDDMEPREKIKIYDKGVKMSGEYGSYGEFLSLRDGNIFIPAVKMREPLKCECEHFIECIEQGCSPRSDGRNGLIVTHVLEAAQRSLKSGGIPVEIDKLI